MSRTKLQTDIVMNYHSTQPYVTITRRKIGIPNPDQVGQWYSSREYAPTVTSIQRLEKLISWCINKNYANVTLLGRSIEVEIVADIIPAR